MPNTNEMEEGAAGMDVEQGQPGMPMMMAGAGREGEGGVLEKETRQLLAELHETYRGLYRHLPPALRPPGMALLEAADAYHRPPAAASSSFLPPLVTLRWASRSMRSALKGLLIRADEASGGQLSPEEGQEMGVIDFTVQVWDLMELCLLADGAGAAGWEVITWAQPFWGKLPEPGRTPESAWHAAWEGVLRGELEHAAEILDTVGVSPDAGASSYRAAPTAANMWFWPSHQTKDRVLSLLAACPLLRAMGVLRDESEARAQGAGGVASSPDDDAYELARRDVGRALAREGERWRRELLRELADLPRDGCQGVRRLLEILAGRDGAAERAVRALKAAGRGGGEMRGWRLRFASKVLYEAPALKGRELADALMEAKEAGQQEQQGPSSSAAAAAAAAAEEGPDSSYDVILGAVLTKDVGPLLQAINNFCRGDKQGHDVERLHLCTSLAALYHHLLLLDLAATHAPALRALRTPVLTARREEMLGEFVDALMVRHIWRPAIAYALGAVDREAGLSVAGRTFAELGPSLAYESKESREWLERIGNAPAGLVGGGTALLLRVPWIEASVAGGKEAWRAYEERGELTALQIAITLWAKSDWGKKEMRDRLEDMCADFLGGLARLLDPLLDDQRVDVSIPDMLAITSAVIAAAAAETSGPRGQQQGAVFNASSPLVRVDVPELLVLYGCRQALARLVKQGGGDGEPEAGSGTGSSLTDALQALVCTLPPRGFAPRRLWPAIVQACLAMLQTALRDDEPRPEPGTAPLDSEQAAALMTCIAQVDVHPRRKEFRGEVEWRQGRREALARTLGRAFADDRKFSVMWNAERAGNHQQPPLPPPVPSQQQQQQQQSQPVERESAFDLLGPQLLLE